LCFDHEQSAETMALVLSRRAGLLSALTTLRALGSEANDAIDTVLELRPVKFMSAAWELWDSVADSAGLSTDELLAKHLGEDYVHVAREALFGDAA
jgi:hypothetical protein